jgi:serine/threonine protein kinase
LEVDRHTHELVYRADAPFHRDDLRARRALLGEASHGCSESAAAGQPRQGTTLGVTVTATTARAKVPPASGHYPDDEGTVEWATLDALVSRQANHLPIDSTGRAVNLIVAGRYHLRTLLGAGGMGKVWLARDEVLQRDVALKQFTNEQRNSRSCVLREARAAARITHPGVVRVHDIVLDEDRDWIVMEALPGRPLSTIIRERGRLSIDEVRHIALRMLSALQAIHDVDLIHRDVKPSNIQLCGEGRVVLTDFGLSSPRDDAADGLSAGGIAGSLRYLAPETIIDGQFGPPSDLYALGVTLYVAVEGHQPFDSDTALSLPDSIRSAALAPPRHAGVLREVLDGLLEKDPARRMDIAHARRHLQANIPKGDRS